MVYVHFIINPVSGKAKHTITQACLEAFFPKDYKIVTQYTNSKGHASQLAKSAVAQGADYIVACGGDGTINEVASELVGTKVALGIVPVGSGNGLAGNLAIKKSIAEALETIAAGNTMCIDIGQINDKYFFSNCGVGLDAAIIKNYEQNGRRTLISYIKASLAAAFSYNYPKAIITYRQIKFEVKPLMLFVSNSNEMGYNMSLTPKASLQDGLLDFVIVPRLNVLYKSYMGLLVLLQKFQKFSPAKHMLVGGLKIEFPDKNTTDVQIDGEYHLFNTNSFAITIQPGKLKVIV
ncbi:diacylglycerol/lipid kinase family protein [Flavobacterium rhizosphaerae]|uniref:Diacylglycerol kinase family protein n=1 Tax=Flavobacterium rhizosphaerae TaxID=3163298 RepID=A0ABW8YZT5_9FLAO